MGWGAAMTRLGLVLGVVLCGCVVNPVPTPVSPSSSDKGGGGKTEETPTTDKDAGTNQQFNSDATTGGVAADDAISGPDMSAADASTADMAPWDSGLPADATELAADATALAADATESLDVQ